MLGLPSCKEVSERTSFLMDGGQLTLSQRLSYKMHLIMCKSCREYLTQMRLTSETLQQWANGKPMPDKLKDQLLQQFEKGPQNSQNLQQGQ